MPPQPCCLFCRTIGAYHLFFARIKKGTTLFPLFQVINLTILLVPFLKTEKQGLPAAPYPSDSLLDTTYASPALLPLLLGDWRISAAFYTIQKGHRPFLSDLIYFCNISSGNSLNNNRCSPLSLMAYPVLLLLRDFVLVTISSSLPYSGKDCAALFARFKKGTAISANILDVFATIPDI